MKEIKVTVNTWYVVEGAAGATVINPLTNRAIATVEDGKQASFLATTPYVVASDDSVNVFKAPFNSAPAKLKLLGLLGGGASTLPAGYLEALFLESSGTQKIRTNLVAKEYVGVFVKMSTFGGTYQQVPVGDASSSTVTFTAPHSNTALSNSMCGYHWNGVYKDFSYTLEKEVPFTSSLNYKNNKLAQINEHEIALSGAGKVGGELVLFAYGWSHVWGNNDNLKGRIYEAIFTEFETEVRNFKPCITESGTPCMFDTVTKQPFYNAGSGDFIVGFTREQAKKLNKLPTSGGSITIALPIAYESDYKVVQALNDAKSNGWTLTIQKFNEETATSTASTFGMQRIWVRKTLGEHGSYVDVDGVRWQVDWCVTMYTPDDSTPDMHGYELFRSVEAACEYWGLEPYVDPDWEDEFLTETN